MAKGIVNIVASYLEDLTATHPICSALGDTLTFGENMFIGGEVATETNGISIIPYGGSPPNIDGNRQDASIQIRSRTTSRYKALEVQQALINTLHMNELNGDGFVQANQSAPIILDTEMGGRFTICISNYRVKHVKI
jgi:hypothetical protein